MKLYSFLLLLLLSLQASSQPIFQEINFSEAVVRSQLTGKLILVQLESLDCEMCNYVVTEAFENKALAKKIAETFIALKVGSKHSDRNVINGMYDFNDNSFGTYFIDGSKNLIHRYDQTTTLVSAYDKEFALALYKNSEVIKLNIYEDVYKKYKDNNQLEQWIWARRNLNLNNDSLLNIYAANLSPDSLASDRVINFLARQAPYLGSKADQVVRGNKQFNKVWYTIPLTERISINKTIISKSLQLAIRYRNEGYAYRVATFAKEIYDNDKKSGGISFNWQFLKYYEGVVNMDQYMAFANVYYDSVLLKTTVGDVRMKDSLNKAEAIRNAPVQPKTQNGKIVSVIRTVEFSPTGQSFTNSLNQAAWFIYKNTNERKYLLKALEWVSKGNKYYLKFEALDTEARLLYKLGEKKAAIELMEKAVKLKNETIKSRTAFTSLYKVLDNMRLGKNGIDAD